MSKALVLVEKVLANSAGSTPEANDLVQHSRTARALLERRQRCPSSGVGASPDLLNYLGRNLGAQHTREGPWRTRPYACEMRAKQRSERNRVAFCGRSRPTGLGLNRHDDVMDH